MLLSALRAAKYDLNLEPHVPKFNPTIFSNNVAFRTQILHCVDAVVSKCHCSEEHVVASY